MMMMMVVVLNETLMTYFLKISVRNSSFNVLSVKVGSLLDTKNKNFEIFALIDVNMCRRNLSIHNMH
jgi:hypothetical protein